MTIYHEISEIQIALGPHCYERNLYELLMRAGAPIVVEKKLGDPDCVRYRSVRPIGRKAIQGKEGHIFWWESQ